MQFTTQNGQKEVILNTAGFKDATELKKAVMKILGNAKLPNFDANALHSADVGVIVNLITQLIFSADSSDEFENAVFKCLAQSHYDKKQINIQLFDDMPEAREDYYEIISKCCEVNLRPFFKSLVSECKTRFQALTKNQEQ